MAKLNGLAIVSVSYFTGEGAKADKNGSMPVILSAVLGKIPSKRVISGTVAQSAGFYPGKNYLATYTEGDPDPEYGRQFNWVNGGAVTPMDTLAAHTQLGAGMIIEVGEIAEDGGGAGGPKLNSNEKVSENAE